jgi:hypothetical protein
MPGKSGWLIDETRPLTDAQIDQLDRELADGQPGSRGAGDADNPTLAVSVHDVVVHDTRKWFGEADIRLDALVVTGYAKDSDPGSFYMPKTANFARIRNDDALQLGPGGLLVFHGRAAHFLDLFVLVSRDQKDSADLATLLKSSLQSDEMRARSAACSAWRSPPPRWRRSPRRSAPPVSSVISPTASCARPRATRSGCTATPTCSIATGSASDRTRARGVFA